jgi:hypothetical protein
MTTLTEMQYKIYLYQAQGLSIKETALALQRSPNTIKTQRRRIRKKMGVSGVTLNIVFFDSAIVTQKDDKRVTPEGVKNLLQMLQDSYNIPNGIRMLK